MKVCKSILGFFAVLVLTAMYALPSWAEWQLAPSLYYESTTNTPNSGTATTTTAYGGNATLGYKFTGPLFVGGTYAYTKSTVSSTSASTTWTDFGPSIGLVFTNFHLIGTYFFSVNQAPSPSTVNSPYTGTSGFEIDVKYMFALSQSIFLGPQMSYISLNYNSTGAPDSNDSYFRPYVAFMFKL